jgi:LPS-assembly lipoprotein
MWSLERMAVRRLLLQLVCLCGAAVSLAGCFQPVYGDHSLTASPATGPALAGVDVAVIDARNGTPEARVAVELRNQLLFDLTGGAAPPQPTYRLTMRLRSERVSTIVDITSGRPDVEDYGLVINYTLTDIKTGKPVFTSDTFARVSYDIPGQAQRFARARGLRDSENRAAKVVADNIRSRLASYFVAGT